ncbi:MAG: aldehyde reductase [Polyangiaceae bacterium]
MQDRDLVVVTGATGFIAMHVIVELLEAGYRVRGTLRRPERGDALRATLAEHADVAHLELVQADLMNDAGWDDVMRGARGVMHVASPVPRTPPKHEDDLIRPAKEGTLRVLAAAARASVKRVVMTSSVAAVIYGHERNGSRTYDESDWSRLGDDVGAYEKSKTIAERAAWDYVASLADDQRLELVTINPGLVLGPVLDEDWGTSGELVRKLMKRELPGCPDVGWAMVDVRDVASAHREALEVPEAAGQRFICAIEHASMLDVAKILDGAFRERGFRVPLRRVPGWLLKAVAIFDKTAALALPELGKRQDVSNARARAVLGWQPRSLEEMVVSMGESLVTHGAV